MRRRMGKNDWILLGAMLVLCLVFLGIWLYFSGGSGDTVTVTVDGEVYGTYDLSEDREIPVEKEGVVCNVVRIRDGQAYMEEADCPDQLCVKQGRISADHATVVCLPNRVVVEISASDTSQGEEDALDEVVR